MNITKEGQAIRRLWDEADHLDAEAAQKTATADDKRWAAAERAHAAVQQPGVTHGKLATAAAMSSAMVSLMVRVWKWWLECQGSYEGRPTFWDGEELMKDTTLRERAASTGKSPTTTAVQERHAKAVAKTPSQAREVVKDKAARAGLKRAIRDAEEEEDRAEAEAIRQRAIADAEKAGRVPVDIPPASLAFGANTQLEAGVLIGKAAKALAAYIRLVRDCGPVPTIAREAYLEELEELQETVAWAIQATKDDVTDWDAALAKLAGE